MVILHVLLSILKVIGILLLVILGLVLVILGLILFVPVRYQVSGGMPKNEMKKANTKIAVTYLLKLIAVKIDYIDTKVNWHLRVAWLHFGSDVEEKPKREKKAKKAKHPEGKKEPARDHVEKPEPAKAEPVKAEPVKSEPVKEEAAQRKPEAVKEEAAETKPASKEPEEKAEQEAHKGRKMLLRREKKEKKEKKKGPSINERVEAAAEKLKCTFSAICDKLSAIDEKKNKLTDFLGNPVHQKGITKILKELRWIVRFLKPKRAEGRIHYGFEDPCTTGQVLAAVSMLYPFTGGNLVIEPDFEEKGIEGELAIAGNLRFYKLAVMLLALVISGPVRRLILDGIKFGKNF